MHADPSDSIIAAAWEGASMIGELTLAETAEVLGKRVGAVRRCRGELGAAANSVPQADELAAGHHQAPIDTPPVTDPPESIP